MQVDAGRADPDPLGDGASVAVDAVGRRLDKLPPASVAEVVTRWPRNGAGETLIELSSRQAQVRPQSRAALMHKLGFKGVVRANPLDG